VLTCVGPGCGQAAADSRPTSTPDPVVACRRAYAGPRAAGRTLLGAALRSRGPGPDCAATGSLCCPHPRGSSARRGAHLRRSLQLPTATPVTWVSTRCLSPSTWIALLLAWPLLTAASPAVPFRRVTVAGKLGVWPNRHRRTAPVARTVTTLPAAGSDRGAAGSLHRGLWRVSRLCYDRPRR